MPEATLEICQSAVLLELWAFSQRNIEVKQWHYQTSYPKNSDWQGLLAYGLAYCLGQDQIGEPQTRSRAGR